MVASLSHITFMVSDLERMGRFLIEIFDAREIYDSGTNIHSIAREKYFLAGDIWIAIIEGRPLPEKSYNHIAFKISESDFDRYAAKIGSMGIEVKSGRSRHGAEGRSLYFYDDDNHMFELHTGTLEDRLAYYTSIE